MRTLPGKGNSATKQLVDRILAVGQMTRQEYLHLTSMLLSASRMTDEERSQINRIFDQIHAGRTKLVD